VGAAAYNQSNFGHVEKRLFSVNNYNYLIDTICTHSGNNHREPETLACQNHNRHLGSTYDPDPYLPWGQGFLWYTALTWPWIHANALYICLTIAYPRMHQQLCIEEDCIFNVKSSPLECCLQGGSQPLWHRAFVLCLACNCRTYPMLCWWPAVGVLFPEAVYTTASDFIWTHKPDLCMENQTALFPWVWSIVIKHYVLGKEVFFWGQYNYFGLYRYLDNFVASIPDIWFKMHHWQWPILMTQRLSICRKRSPKSYTLCQSQKYWLGPWRTAHPLGEGFIVPLLI
jgi:hypothetical protein